MEKATTVAIKVFAISLRLRPFIGCHLGFSQQPSWRPHSFLTAVLFCIRFHFFCKFILRNRYIAVIKYLLYHIVMILRHLRMFYANNYSLHGYPLIYITPLKLFCAYTHLVKYCIHYIKST